MFLSTVTFPALGQKTRWAFMSTSSPIQRASHAQMFSFDPLALCTSTGVPHVWRADKLGGQPYNASNGVLPSSARVAVQFFSQVACLSTSPHKDLGRPLVCVKARILSSSVRLRCSVMPFS